MTYILPVSKKQRKSWGHKPPADCQNTGSDRVAYHAKPKGGADHNYADTACYSSMRPNYDQFEITCHPQRVSGALSLKDAVEFFEIMASHGLVPEGVSLWEKDGGLHCQIPEGCGNPHNIYVALTCYRWVDSHAPLVWEFLRIMSEDVPRHPLQILPYLVSKNVGNCNHSFITTSGWQVQLEGHESGLNPVLGLAAKIYFDPEDKRGQKSYENPSAWINNAVAHISRGIAPEIKVPSTKNYGASTVLSPKYVLEKPVDGLHPDLYKLYATPNITPEQVLEILEGLFTKEK